MTIQSSLIIDVYDSGFCSNYLIWLDNLKYCEINNIKPIPRLFGDWYYSDNRENLWDYYFEKINDGLPIGNINYSRFFKLWEQNSFTVNQGNVLIWKYDKDNEQQIKNRQEVNKVSQKIIPVKRIKEKVDDFFDKNFKNKRVLGVHVRGTDYGFYNLEAYLNEIQKNKNFDLIFIASDNFEAIDYFKKNCKNVCCFDTDIRMKNMNDNVLCKNLNSLAQKLKHGDDILIDTYLLSKCEHLICINSNVSAVALYMNPKMTYSLIFKSNVGG